MNVANAAILVVSCDKYADVWAPFFEIFWKRWPDCPLHVFLGSNKLRCDDPRVTTIPIGPDTAWTANLRSMLERLPADWVLMFLEDFLLTAPVDTDAVMRSVEIAIENRVGCLRLAPRAYAASARTPNADIGDLPRGSDYRVSTQAAIWRKDTLLGLCREDWTAWQFEVLGSPSSDLLREPFWSVRRPILHYRQSVQRGKWLPEGLAICRDAGVGIDLTRRPVLSLSELVLYRSVQLRSRLVMLLPGSLRRRIRLLRYGARGGASTHCDGGRGSR